MCEDKLEVVQAQAVTTTPADLLRIAVDQNADLDKLERLMDLQQRWEADQARKAYSVAIAAFRADCPAVLDRDTEVHFKTAKGVVNYKHATLGEIARVVTPHLCRHGLSYDWTTEQGDRGTVQVTCTLTHQQGHSKAVTLSGPLDARTTTAARRTRTSPPQLARPSTCCSPTFRAPRPTTH